MNNLELLIVEKHWIVNIGNTSELNLVSYGWKWYLFHLGLAREVAEDPSS